MGSAFTAHVGNIAVKITNTTDESARFVFRSCICVKLPNISKRRYIRAKFY
ncbi:hypothetical protein VHA_001828 [Grimontia hollisae CIP 101886]|uniref:Uncharacterized protein n=1 Tax=Grimontia hollisae CIP 101886 TaxID=675812 RepID=D0I7V4_GRIHO|nr:hypothetical protein VHA_001828 [Grimontia hollisae CIP 101886]